MITTLDKNDYEQYKEHIDGTFNMKTFNEFIDNLSINHQIIVMKIDDNIIGSGTILIEHKLTYGGCKLGHIENVLINGIERGHGYGYQIVNKLIDIGTSQGCYRIDLVCKEELIPFYNKINRSTVKQSAISYMIEENFK